MKKIYRQEVWIFAKMLHRIPFLLALCASVRRFQMPLKGLNFVEAFEAFSNYWMRLSRIWRILRIEEGVIHRGNAEMDNTPRDLQNYSYPTKTEFNTCFIISSKYFPRSQRSFAISLFAFLLTKLHNLVPSFSRSTVQYSGLHFWRHFNVIGSRICSGLRSWRRWFNMAKILSKFGEQQLVMVNYVCGFKK